MKSAKEKMLNYLRDVNDFAGKPKIIESKEYKGDVNAFLDSLKNSTLDGLKEEIEGLVKNVHSGSTESTLQGAYKYLLCTETLKWSEDKTVTREKMQFENGKELDVIIITSEDFTKIIAHTSENLFDRDMHKNYAEFNYDSKGEFMGGLGYDDDHELVSQFDALFDVDA